MKLNPKAPESPGRMSAARDASEFELHVGIRGCSITMLI